MTCLMAIWPWRWPLCCFGHTPCQSLVYLFIYYNSSKTFLKIRNENWLNHFLQSLYFWEWSNGQRSRWWFRWYELLWVLEDSWTSNCRWNLWSCLSAFLEPLAPHQWKWSIDEGWCVSSRTSSCYGGWMLHTRMNEWMCRLFLQTAVDRSRFFESSRTQTSWDHWSDASSGGEVLGLELKRNKPECFLSAETWTGSCTLSQAAWWRSERCSDVPLNYLHVHSTVATLDYIFSSTLHQPLVLVVFTFYKQCRAALEFSSSDIHHFLPGDSEPSV